MEDISPTLLLLWEIKRALEKSQSIHVGIESFLKKAPQLPFSNQVEAWWKCQTTRIDKGKDSRELQHEYSISLTRKYLLEILEQGLRGQSILETLKSYEKELIQSCEDEIQSHIAKLPLVLMIPLMGLIFPALMILLIGPIMSYLSF